MSKEIARGLWRFAYSLLFYPVVIALVIWLVFTHQHWIWAVLIIAAVLILDPIYRILLKSLLSWRPKK